MLVKEYEPGVYEVKFTNSSGQAYALETLHAEQLMILHHQPIMQLESV